MTRTAAMGSPAERHPPHSRGECRPSVRLSGDHDQSVYSSPSMVRVSTLFVPEIAWMTSAASSVYGPRSRDSFRS